MNLYKIKTMSLGQTYYVVANDPTEAQESLKRWLDDEDFDMYTNRKAVTIELLAEDGDLRHGSNLLIARKPAKGLGQ